METSDVIKNCELLKALDAINPVFWGISDFSNLDCSIVPEFHGKGGWLGILPSCKPNHAEQSDSCNKLLHTASFPAYTPSLLRSKQSGQVVLTNVIVDTSRAMRCLRNDRKVAVGRVQPCPWHTLPQAQNSTAFFILRLAAMLLDFAGSLLPSTQGKIHGELVLHAPCWDTF